MKKTQRRDLITTIKGTFVSFFSILMFVALGVGVFLGINWSGMALRKAAQREFDAGLFHSFQIQYTYGLTESDIQKLSQVEGVTDVEPAYLSYQTVKVNGENITVKTTSLTDRINVPMVQKGELPTQPNEMAVFVESAEVLGVDVGDTITFEKDMTDDPDDEPSDGMQFLNGSEYKVTALVKNAEYVAESPATYGISGTPSGTVDALVWLPREAYDPEAFLDGHPVVNISCDSLAGLDTYGDAYKSASNEIEARIVELGKTLGAARYDELYDAYQQTIDDGMAEMNEAEAEIEQGKKDVADGEKKLEDGKKTLEDERAKGEADLASAHEELMGYEKELAEADSELTDAENEVERAENALADVDAAEAEARAIIDEGYAQKAELDDLLKEGDITKEEYDTSLDALGNLINDQLSSHEVLGKSVPTINHNNYEASLELASKALDGLEDQSISYQGRTITIREARAELADAEQELQKAQAEYEEAARELDDGWAQYHAGEDELNTKVADAEKELADGEAQLEDAKKQIADGEAEVAANKPLLESLKTLLDDMNRYEWTVLARNSNAGASEVTVFSNVTINLSFSMALLFVVVGLLVSYFAVSRIVHERVTQIGAKKALGLRTKEITAGFLWYSAIAVIIGAIVGTLLGVFLVEGIIDGALGDMFTFGNYPPFFGLVSCLVVSAIELVLVLLSTWLACKKILRERAVVLLRGENTTQAKERFFEKWAIWQKLSLFTQTMVNNCLNEKRRMFSTIVGVAGCTALIVTALTLNDDVLKSYDEQYENVYNFNIMAYVDPFVDGAMSKVEGVLRQEGATTTPAMRKTMVFAYGEDARGVTEAIVPTDETAFSRAYHVNPSPDGTVDLSQDGVWVSQALAEHFDAKVGDKITVYADDGTTHDLPILGFYEFWLAYHEMVMGSSYYQKEFGEVLPNVVLADSGDVPVEELSDKVMAVPGAFSIEDDKIDQYGSFETFSTVSGAVVAIYLVLAVLMAIVTLLNLNIMCINEKKRELIVLMINGFSVHDAKRYIYNDTIVLTILGILVGLLVGCIMGTITVGSIEPSTATFIKGVDLIAIVVGILGSALLSLIMSLIALRRIPRFALTDINRT